MTADERPPSEGRPALPRGWARHPQERMLITPLDRRHRRADRLLHRRRDRRLAADPHLRPAALGRLGAALEPARQGPEPLRLERLLRVPLRLLAPAGRPLRALLPLPEGLPARRLLRQRPVAQPARHRAHRARPLAGGGLAPGRLAARPLLRPALRGPVLADAADEVALLRQAGRGARHLRRDAERQVRAPALRRASSTRSTSCSRTRASRTPYKGFQGAHKPIARAERRRLKRAGGPARGGAEPLADRPQLLALRQSAPGDRAEPLPGQGRSSSSAASAATA